MKLMFVPTSGSQFPLTVSMGSYYPVLRIKKRIEQETGIPISYQTLYHDQGHLDDEFNLAGSTITDEDTIVLVINPPEPLLRLIILQQTGNAFSVNLPHRSVTVGDIKEKIQQEKGIPINSQTLFHFSQVLEDNINLIDTTIMHLSRLDLEIAGDPVPQFPPQGPLPPPPPAMHLQQGFDQPPPQLGPSSNSHQEHLQEDASLVYRQMGNAQQPRHQFNLPQPHHQVGLPRNLQQGIQFRQPQHQLGLPMISHQEMGFRQQFNLPQPHHRVSLPRNLQKGIQFRQPQHQLGLPMNSHQEMGFRQQFNLPQPHHQVGLPRNIQQGIQFRQPQYQPGLPVISHQEMGFRQQLEHQRRPAVTEIESWNQRLVQSIPPPTIQKINLTMQIFEYTVTLDRDQNITGTIHQFNANIDFDKSQTIRQVKKMIENAGIVSSAERLTIFFKNNKLEDNRNLGSYEIPDGSVIVVIVDYPSSPPPSSGTVSGNKIDVYLSDKQPE